MKNKILTLLFLSFMVNLNAQQINNLSDFFRNKKGQIKLSKSKQTKLKTILGSNFNGILECCEFNQEYSVSKTSDLLSLKINKLAASYNDRYQKNQILTWRNRDTVSKMNLNIDTINYLDKLTDIIAVLKKIDKIEFEKKKISIYLNAKSYESSDLKKYQDVLNILDSIRDISSNIEKKLNNWEQLLEPIEKQRLARAKEEWKQFVKSQMLIRWEIEKEKIEKEEGERKRELEEQEKRELQEEQKFNNWKKNLRFSIKYKQEAIEGYYRCNRCQEESICCYDDKFPKLDFSNYAYPDYMENLWEEHKSREETADHSLFFNNTCGMLKFGSVLTIGSGKYDRCEYCGTKLKYFEKSKFLNKTFKN